MSVFKKIHNGVLYKIELALAYLSGIAVLAMMFHLTLDVLMRNILGVSITGTYEITQYYYMPIAALPCMAYVYRNNVLPVFDGVVSKISGRLKTASLVFIFVVEVVSFYLLARYAVNTAINNYVNNASFTSGGKIMPTWWVAFFMPVSYGLMFIECIFNRVEQIFFNDGEKEEITEQKKDADEDAQK